MSCCELYPARFCKATPSYLKARDPQQNHPGGSTNVIVIRIITVAITIIVTTSILISTIIMCGEGEASYHLTL